MNMNTRDWENKQDLFYKWCRAQIYHTWISKNNKIVNLNPISEWRHNVNFIIDDVKFFKSLNFNKLIVFEKDDEKCRKLQYQNLERGFENNSNSNLNLYLNSNLNGSINSFNDNYTNNQNTAVNKINWIVADITQNKCLFNLIMKKIFYLESSINVFTAHYFFPCKNTGDDEIGIDIDIDIDEGARVINQTLKWIFKYLKNDGFFIGTIIDRELIQNVEFDREQQISESKNLNMKAIDWNNFKNICSKSNFNLIDSWPCISRIRDYQNYLKQNNYPFDKNNIFLETICSRMFVFQKKV